MRKALFLDRDGTLIRDANYLSDPDKIEILPGVVEALREAAQAGYALIVVSNQSAVARGMCTREDVEAVNRRLTDFLAVQGVQLLDILYCPHGPSDNCPCRKPKPGLLLEAAAKHAIDLKSSAMIGDQPRDIEAGKAAGCATNILLGENCDKTVVPSAPNLREAVSQIL